MAHYAFLDENNIVTLVITGKDEGTDGVDWESIMEIEEIKLVKELHIILLVINIMQVDPLTEETLQDQAILMMKQMMYLLHLNQLRRVKHLH